MTLPFMSLMLNTSSVCGPATGRLDPLKSRRTSLQVVPVGEHVDPPVFWVGVVGKAALSQLKFVLMIVAGSSGTPLFRTIVNVPGWVRASESWPGTKIATDAVAVALPSEAVTLKP